MVGLTGSTLDEATARLLRETHVGSVFYLAHLPRGVAGTATMSQAVASNTVDSVPVLIATDQEGGRVQRLVGSGFSRIPAAAVQASDPSSLRSHWARYAAQLRAAGVRYDLAPVTDIVPANMIATNAPIGRLQRYYGTDPQTVGAHVSKVVQGLHDGGVATSVKHFPGLGRVTTNTDFGVATDTVTTSDDPYLQAFQTAIAGGADSVMVSSSIYQRIDPGVPAVFSSTIVTGILRQKLGFAGVVISDDLGAAGAVASTAAGERGTKFLVAGGDLVIDADTHSLRAMIADTLARMGSDATFAGEVDQKVARVLSLKASVGLVRCQL